MKRSWKNGDDSSELVEDWLALLKTSRSRTRKNGDWLGISEVCRKPVPVPSFSGVATPLGATFSTEQGWLAISSPCRKPVPVPAFPERRFPLLPCFQQSRTGLNCALGTDAKFRAVPEFGVCTRSWFFPQFVPVPAFPSLLQRVPLSESPFQVNVSDLRPSILRRNVAL